MDPFLERLIPGSIGVLLAGGAGLYFTRELVRAALSKRWPTVEGEITKSQRVDTKTKNGLLSQAWIEYRYEVGGQFYFGERVCFGDRLTGNGGVTEDRLRRFPKGRRMPVHVNPRNPRDATLLPTASMMVWLYAGLGLVLGCVIAGAIVNGG